MEVWRNLVFLMMALFIVGSGEGQLAENFYRFSCPFVEDIVRQEVMKKMSLTFVTVPATLRLFFHDCFVEGCDASVLITSPNGDAEKNSEENLSLAGDGFDTVIKAKQAVEALCPGVVSCADVLALAARDVVALSGGPSFSVELGRRDGLISQSGRVPGNLPSPDFSLNLLAWNFRKNNLSFTDMIALSGAHTVGFSHCHHFSDRLYSSSPPSPRLDPTYAEELKKACPPDVDPSIAVNMDASTATEFDNGYYQNLVEGKGMFISDQVLFAEPSSRPTVVEFSKRPEAFSAAFAAAMVRLGRVGVKTGEQGEIRRDCSAFN